MLFDFNHFPFRDVPRGTFKRFCEWLRCLFRLPLTQCQARRSASPVYLGPFQKIPRKSRYLRTTAIRIKPGQSPVLEGLLKDVKAAREKSSPDLTTLVSQGEAGQEGTMFYVTTLEKSMAGFDSIPPLRKAMADEASERYLKTASEIVVKHRDGDLALRAGNQ